MDHLENDVRIIAKLFADEVALVGLGAAVRHLLLEGRRPVAIQLDAAAMGEELD